jgi:hypothetical protein
VSLETLAAPLFCGHSHSTGETTHRGIRSTRQLLSDMFALDYCTFDDRGVSHALLHRGVSITAAFGIRVQRATSAIDRSRRQRDADAATNTHIVLHLAKGDAALGVAANMQAGVAKSASSSGECA